MVNAAVPELTFHYTRFRQITDDVDDARVYGGIHFRFDQDAGADLGRSIARYIYRHNLRPVKRSHHDGDDEDEEENRNDDRARGRN